MQWGKHTASCISLFKNKRAVLSRNYWAHKGANSAWSHPVAQAETSPKALSWSPGQPHIIAQPQRRSWEHWSPSHFISALWNQVVTCLGKVWEQQKQTETSPLNPFPTSSNLHIRIFWARSSFCMLNSCWIFLFHNWKEYCAKTHLFLLISDMLLATPGSSQALRDLPLNEPQRAVKASRSQRPALYLSRNKASWWSSKMTCWKPMTLPEVGHHTKE